MSVKCFFLGHKFVLTRPKHVVRMTEFYAVTAGNECLCERCDEWIEHYDPSLPELSLWTGVDGSQSKEIRAV